MNEDIPDVRLWQNTKGDAAHRRRILPAPGNQKILARCGLPTFGAEMPRSHTHIPSGMHLRLRALSAVQNGGNSVLTYHYKRQGTRIRGTADYGIRKVNGETPSLLLCIFYKESEYALYPVLQR